MSIVVQKTRRSCVRVPPSSTARVRLFCLPYAGGTVSAFGRWPEELPLDIQVCPMQLAGRQNRFAEPAFTRIEPLVQELAPIVAEYSDLPFVLFGHSMGGLIAFELARQLRRSGSPVPALLLIGGCRAPQLPGRAPMTGLPDDDFVAALRRFNGVPEALSTQKELMELMLPTIRADVELCETYRYTPEPPLDCPIFAYGGSAPGEVTFQELAAWQGQTQGAFRVRTFEGSHFFLEESRSSLLKTIDADLHAILP